MKLIPLTQGMSAMVDDEDYEYLSQWKWCAHKAPKTFYAHRHTRKNERIEGKDKTICMHRVIMNTPDDKECDHVFHNGLDNRKYIEINGKVKQNLRNCTKEQNRQNRQPCGSRSKYMGVSCWVSRKNGKSYNHIAAQIYADGKHRYLGHFKTEEAAARAYDVAALHYFGEFANLNFKD